MSGNREQNLQKNALNAKTGIGEMEGKQKNDKEKLYKPAIGSKQEKHN